MDELLTYRLIRLELGGERIETHLSLLKMGGEVTVRELIG